MSQSPPLPPPQPGDPGHAGNPGDPGNPRSTGDSGEAATAGPTPTAGTTHADGTPDTDDPTATTAPPLGPPPAATPGRLADELRTLRRSRSDRVVAGVLGGLGRRLGIDPVILRVVTVVLAFFGGAGILLYALGWLLIPEEGEDRSALDHAFGRGAPGTGGAPAVLLALLLGIVALASAGAVLGGSWDGAALLVLACVGVVLLLRRGGSTHEGSPEPGAGPWSPPGTPTGQPYGGGHPTTYGAPADDPGAAWAAAATGMQQQATASVPTAAPVDGSPAGPGWETGADWEQPAWDPTATWTQDPATEPGWHQPVPVAAPPRPRSVLGPVTVSLALVSVGVLAVLDGPVGLDVPFAGYLAAALGVVGLGLLVGTWVGRSRGLVWLGLLLALAMVPAVAVDRFGSWEETDITVQPTTTAELAGPHEYSGGRVVWDLTALELPDATAPTLTIDQGAGQLVVVVPETTDVTVDATVGVGELRTFDTVTGGFGNERSTVDLGPDGEGGGRLTLELDLGIGQLEVRRGPA
ncbi:MAG TPA: PspC domain-containing protein [Jiangellales bacterium]|nr:PspC domain-containing protein [Jiangellales bacterium]